MAAIFTTADRDAVKAAIVEAATDGFASVTIGGQTTAVKSLDELRRILEMIQADLASAASHSGLRIKQLVPGECG